MGAAIEAYKWEKGEPKKKLTQYRGELQRKLDELLGATREAEGAAVQKSACAWKRYKPNELGQKISEARNLAAHVERLLAALDWAQESLTGCHVLFCDPTTSDEAHDLVIKSGADRVLVSRRRSRSSTSTVATSAPPAKSATPTTKASTARSEPSANPHPEVHRSHFDPLQCKPEKTSASPRRPGTTSASIAATVVTGKPRALISTPTPLPDHAERPDPERRQ